MDVDIFTKSRIALDDNSKIKEAETNSVSKSKQKTIYYNRIDKATS